MLRTLFLTFDEQDWESELQDLHGTDVDVAATLLVDGKNYKDVGVRFRGMSSYMAVPEGRKRSLNLSLDMAHEDQNVGGYRTLNLLNAHEDPTFVRAVLFLHIARQYIPAPKANFVRVVINGEDWGIYANVQQFNKDFLKENYSDSNGARWKVPGPNPRGGLSYLGGDASVYKQTYEIKTKDDNAQWSALMNLTRTLSEAPADQLEKELSSVLDIDGALRFLALDNVLVNNDGYWTRGSDYSLYRDTSGKFHLIPHDTNETFATALDPSGRGRGGRGPGPGFPPGPPPQGGLPPNGPRGFEARGGRGGRGPGPMGDASLDPLIGLDDASKPLRARLLSVPSFRAKYLRYVREISSTWLNWQALGPLVEQYRTLIDPHVRVDAKKLYTYDSFVAGFEGTQNSLKTFVTERNRYLTSRAE